MTVVGVSDASRTFPAGTSPSIGLKETDPKAPSTNQNLRLPPCRPVNLEFRNLRKEVKVGKKGGCILNDEGTKKQILCGVSGVLEAGTLTAVLGASGAGKTTLLEVLSGRSLCTSGEFYWNKIKIKSSHLYQKSAIVQQIDAFLPNLTVREHLQYQARLRLAKSSRKECDEIVETIVERLGLSVCADTRIGSVIGGGKRGISGGESKRLAFASEILVNPSVLLCDEPTSGLDSFMAQSVVDVMKTIAHSGRTVVATIHQPSSQVYAMFDKVMLLGEGRIVYHGTKDGALSYFSSLGYQCPCYTNPAEFMMNAICGDKGKFVELHDVVIKDAMERPTEAFPAQRSIHDEDTYSSALEVVKIHSFGEGPPDAFFWVQQTLTLTARAFLNTSRDISVTFARGMQTLVLSVICGLIYFRLSNEGVKAPRDKGGGLFFVLMNQGFTGFYTVLRAFSAEKLVANREAHARVYTYSSYFTARLLSDVPLQIGYPCIFVTVSYWMMGLRGMRVFFPFLGVHLLSANAAMGMGYIVSAATRDLSMALAIGPLLIIPALMFGGIVLNVESIPPFWRWLEHMSFFKYGFSALSSLLWSGLTLHCPPPLATSASQQPCYETGEQVLSSLSIRPSDFWRDVFVLSAMVIGFRLIAMVVFVVKGRRAGNQPLLICSSNRHI